MIVVVDFLAAIVLIQQAIIARSTIEKVRVASIRTDGVYAVTLEWPSRPGDDVDLYVQDPAGDVCYFANASVGLMNLEHDDLGHGVSETQAGMVATPVVADHERTVLRGALAGEYVANAHMYLKGSGAAPTVVTVRLWSLRGTDRVLLTRQVTLRATGDERTAFRFTLDRAGALSGTSDLQKLLVGQGAQTPVSG